MSKLTDTPLVSVVMIAYNMERYIDTAIKGVVSQKTGFPFELIVMDDCSTDSTPDKIEAWRQRYPDIVRNVRNPVNLGLQANYLAGFSRCRGRYMAICDADDYWFNRRKLSRQVEYMERNPGCTITFHRMINYYEATGEKSLSNGGQSTDTGIEQLSRSNFITNSSVMYRREAVDLTSLPEWIKEERSPDYAMHILYARAGSIHFFSRPMGVYRKAAGSSWSMTDQYEKLRMSLSVRQRLMGELTDCDVAINGLWVASQNILIAMNNAAETPQEKAYVQEKAQEMGIELPCNSDRSGNAPMRKPFISRIRGVISRIIPLPTP